MARTKRRNRLLKVATITVLLVQTASPYKDYDGQYGINSGGLITSCRYPGTQGYFVTEEKYPYSAASDACSSFGGSLADLSNQNFLLASDLVLTCVGPNQRAWIGSWDYSANYNNNQDCLSIFVGSIGPGGGIKNICVGDKPVLCQRQPSTVPHNSSYTQPDITYLYPTAVPSVHGARHPHDHSPDNYAQPSDFVLHQPNYGVNHPRQPIYPSYDYISQEPYYSRSHRPIASVNHPRPPHPLPHPHPYRDDDFSYSRDSGYARDGAYPQGPHGGYPGGVYPGGSGYGNAGFPYGYPGKNGYKHYKYGHTVTQTITVDGVIKTITLSGETTVTLEDHAYTVTYSDVKETVTLDRVPTTVTLDGSLTTVTFEGEPSTVTKIINGETVTITADGQPITVTEVVQGIPSTTTIDGVPTTLTLYYTNTLTDFEVLTATVNNTLVINNTLTEFQVMTVTETLTLPSDNNVTLAGTALSQDIVTEPGLTTTVQQVITLTPDRITVAETTVTLPATTSVVTLSPATAVLTVAGTTTTITIPGTAETITVSGPASLVTLPASTITQFATTQVTQTVSIPPVTVTVTQQANSDITSFVTITEAGHTVTVPGSTLTETKYITVHGSSSIGLPTFDLGDGYSITGFAGPGVYTVSPGNVVSVGDNGGVSFIMGGSGYTGGGTSSGNSLPSVTLPGGFVLPNFGGPGTYTVSPGNVVSIDSKGGVSWLQGGPQATPATSQSDHPLSDGFALPNFGGPGIYTASPGNVISIGPDGAYSWIQGGPASASSASGPAVSLPGGFVLPNFSGPGVYTASPGNVVSIDPNGSYTWLQGGPSSGTSATQPAITLPGGFVLPNFGGPGVYTASPGNVVSIGSDGSYSWIQGGPSSAAQASGTQPAVTLPGGFVLPNFSGPGVYTASSGNVVSIGADGAYSWIQGGPSSQTSAPHYPVNLPGGYTISDFSGPGTYTVSPGNVVSISPNGALSWLQGGPNAASQTSVTSQNAVSLPGGFTIPNFSGPGTYTVSPGNVVSIDPSGGYTWLQGGPSSATSGSQSAITLPGGFVLPNFGGPGVYTASPGNVVSIGADGSYSWIQGGPSQSSATHNPVALPGGYTISDFSGPGTYTVSPGNVVSIAPNGALSWLQGGPNATSRTSGIQPAMTLPGGFVLPNFSGPGVYTASPGNVVSIGANGAYSWIQGGPSSQTSAPHYPVSLPGGYTISDFSGPGTYTVSPGNVVSIAPNGALSWLQGGPNATSQTPATSQNAVSLPGGFTIPNFTGPGTYTVSPGNIVSISPNGSFSWIQGGPSATSAPQPAVTLPGGFVLPNFGGPGVYTASPGNVVSINADGSFSWLQGGPSSQTPAASQNAVSLPGGFTIPNFTGPGTYTVSPGNVVSIAPNGALSWLQGGPSAASQTSGSQPAVTLPGGFTIPNFSGPGAYTLSPGNVVSINADGSFNWLQGGPKSNSSGSFTFPNFNFPSITFPNINLPTLNLPTINLNGISLSGYSGAGTYTLDSGAVVSLGSNGQYSYLSGTGPNGNTGGSITLPSLNLPSLTLSGGLTIPSYHGPGVYTYSPGNVVSIGANGGVTWIQGGPQKNSAGGFTFPSFSWPSITFPSITLPTLNLPTINLNGISLSGYSGAGTYTLGSGAVLSLGSNGQYSYLSGTGPNGNTGGSITLPSLSLPSLTLSGGLTIPSYHGPGVYSYSPGNVVSIGPNGGVNWIQGGPQTNSAGGFTFPSFGWPSITFPSITLPTLNLPTISLGGGISLSGYSGAGTYTLGSGSVISLGSNGQYTYLSGTGPNGNTGGSITLPSLNLPTLTLSGGLTIPSYNGPGVYTYSPGNVVSIGPNGGVTWIQGGPQSAPGGGFTFPSFGWPSITFPSITLPTLNLPTINLNGVSLSGYSGAGTYTLGQGSVISLGSNGQYTYISGTGPNGDTGGSITLPSLTLPSVTLSGGITVPNFSGPGIYTLSPGNVVSIGPNGGISWLEGPKTNSDGGFTFPSFGFPTITFPSITLPSVSFASVDLGGGYTISNYKGPGTYTIGFGNIVSVSPGGSYSFIMGGGFGTNTGSVSLPSVSLPAVTLSGGISISGFSGPGTYTYSPGNVVSIDGNGRISWIQGGPQSAPGGGFTFPSFGWPTITFPSITLPTLNLPTINLGGGISLSGYSGAGTYTLGSGSVISLGSNGQYTYLSGTGPNGGTGGSITLPSLNLPTLTLSGGLTIPSYNGPGVYTYSPGNVVSIGANGGVTWVQGGPQSAPGGGFTFPSFGWPSITFPSITLPTLNLPTINLNGISLSGYSGAGTYTLGSGAVLSLGSNGQYSYLSGTGPNGNTGGSITLPSLSLPSLTLSGGLTIPSYHGPGVYTYSPGNVVSIGPNGGVNWIQGGPQTNSAGGFTFPSFGWPSITFPSITLPTLNLPTINLNGISLSGYSGAGTYTLGPGSIVSLGSNGQYSYISGAGPNGDTGGSITLPSLTLPSVTLSGGIIVPNFSGPGIYTLSPGNVVSIGPNGGINWIEGPKTNSNGGFTFPSFGFPTITFPSITLPSVSFASVDLGGGYTISNYKGPGTYTIGFGNIVSVSPGGSYSFIMGGGFGTNTGSVSLPIVSLPTITLSGGISIPSFSGPGTYTYSPGNVVSIDGNGGISWVQGGPQSAPGGGFTFPSFGWPSITFPSITLPTLNLPTINLNGVSLSGYSGAGTYTLGQGSVISLGSNGQYTYISGTGPNGDTGGSITLPSLTLPSVTLSGGITVPNFSGPGIYTLSPGNVVSIGPNGGINWLEGPKTNSNGGFTFPSFGFPTLSSPSVTLPSVSFASIDLGRGYTISNYKGPGTYTLGFGNIVSVSPGGSFSFVMGGGFGVNTGSVSLPSLSFPTLTLSGGIPITGFSGPGTYTFSPGNVVSVDGNGGITWIQGGPQSAPGGGFTFPTISLTGSSSAVQTSAPGTYVINGTTFKFPFRIPGFYGPGVYILSPGNVVQVDADASYHFISGGPPSSLAISSGAPLTSKSASPTAPTTTPYPTTFASITLPSVSFPSLNLFGNVKIPSYTGPGVYSVNGNSAVVIDSGGSYSYIAGNGPLGVGSGSVDLPKLELPTITLTGGLTVPGYKGSGEYTISPGNVLTIDSSGGVKWIVGGPQSLTRPSPTFATSITLPSISFPSLDIPSGGKISTFSGPGVYTLDRNTVVSVDSAGSYSYLLGNGFLGIKNGNLRIPTISYPSVNLPGNFDITFSGAGTYTVDPTDVVAVNSNGNLQWIVGGPLHVTPAASVAALSTSINGVQYNFPFNIPNFSGPGVYVVNQDNVVQVNSDGSYKFISGNAPPSITGSPYVIPSLTLPSISLPTVTLGGIVLPSYTGPGIYAPAPGNIIAVYAQGVISVITGTNVGPGATPGATVSLSSLTLSTVNLPTVTLPGNYVISGYKGPGDYTINPGTVIEVGTNGNVAFIAGAPSTSLNGSGFTFPSFTFPRITLPTISLPSFGLKSSTVTAAAKSMSTVVGGTTFTFPFSIPSFYGPGVYILSPGNVVNVLADGSYHFISGSAPKRIQLEPISVSGDIGEKSASSQGFVLPGFSFPDFSRRAVPSSEPTSASSSKENNAGFLSSVLALF